MHAVYTGVEKRRQGLLLPSLYFTTSANEDAAPPQSAALGTAQIEVKVLARPPPPPPWFMVSLLRQMFSFCSPVPSFPLWRAVGSHSSIWDCLELGVGTKNYPDHMGSKLEKFIQIKLYGKLILTLLATSILSTPASTLSIRFNCPFPNVFSWDFNFHFHCPLFAAFAPRPETFIFWTVNVLFL